MLFRILQAILSAMAGWSPLLLLFFGSKVVIKNEIVSVCRLLRGLCEPPKIAQRMGGS